MDATLAQLVYALARCDEIIQKQNQIIVGLREELEALKGEREGAAAR